MNTGCSHWTRECTAQRFRGWSWLKCEYGDEEERKIDGSGPSGGNFAGGFHEAAGLAGEQAGAGAARARDADGEIVHERRRITAETAMRLARYFKTNAEFWLNLQNFYGLECARRAGKVLEIERQVQPAGAE